MVILTNDTIRNIRGSSGMFCKPDLEKITLNQHPWKFIISRSRMTMYFTKIAWDGSVIWLYIYCNIENDMLSVLSFLYSSRVGLVLEYLSVEMLHIVILYAPCRYASKRVDGNCHEHGCDLRKVEYNIKITHPQYKVFWISSGIFRREQCNKMSTIWENLNFISRYEIRNRRCSG